MNKDTENVALVDLDGTLADHDLALTQEMVKLRGPNEPIFFTVSDHKKYPPYIRARMNLIRTQGSWWENLPPFKLGFDVLEILREEDFYISILTQGPKVNPIAWSHKIIWCLKHVPDLDVTITRNKGIVYGRLLVDDYPEYIQLWVKHRPRGIVIMPANIGNATFTHPQVLRYDGTNLPQVRALIKKVRNRKHGELVKI